MWGLIYNHLGPPGFVFQELWLRRYSSFSNGTLQRLLPTTTQDDRDLPQITEFPFSFDAIIFYLVSFGVATKP